MRLPGFIAFALLPICVACGPGVGNPSALQNEASRTCREGAKPMARLELLFGTGRANGPPVSQREWASFLDREVTPRFPEGLTVLTGSGQWRDRAGTVVRERSIVLVIWYEPTDGSETAIEAIRTAYKRRFAQESVMRADGVSCVSF